MIPAKPEYLRLSVTARCNLRCTYCRPDDASTSAEPEMTPSELRLLVECAAAEGVRKVRLTGGEPLAREDLEDIVAAVSGVSGIDDTVLTTNGVGLAGRTRSLRQAGLDRVNVSLDSLRARRYASICGDDRLAEALDGIEEAVEVFPLVKTNTVLVDGWNIDEVAAFVRFAERAGVRPRFIELYPAERAGDIRGPGWEAILQRLRSAFGNAEPVEGDELSVERLYRLPEAGGLIVGIIASAADPPCKRCAKLRVGPTGLLLPCLFSRQGTPLLPAIRSGDRASIREALRRVFAGKERRGRCGRAISSACELGG